MKLRSLVCLFGVSVALLLAATTAWAQEEEVIVIRAGRMIDGTGVPAVEDVVVIVRGDTIAAVGERGAVQLPPGARIAQDL